MDGLCTANAEDRALTSIGEYLASVEKKAYIMALSACQDKEIALDIVQDAMYSMVKNYKNKPHHSRAALFFGVLNNRISDHHRKRGFSTLTQWFGGDSDEAEGDVEAVDQLESKTSEPDTFVDSLQINSAVRLALVQLSDRQKRTLILRLWQGLSVKETSQAMGISEGSVKTHLSRAVQEMRRLLSEYNPE